MTLFLIPKQVVFHFHANFREWTALVCHKSFLHPHREARPIFALERRETHTESLDGEMSIDADEVSSLRLMHVGKFQWTLRLGKLKWLDMA